MASSTVVMVMVVGWFSTFSSGSTICEVGICEVFFFQCPELLL